jgi:hypothetical protein
VKLIVTLIVALSLYGCASYKAVPDNYAGPKASLTDTGIREDGSKAQVFVLEEIDGKQILNSINASAGASYGQGFSLTTKFVSRDIPAQPMKVKLKGTHITGAPIQALFSQVAGTFLSVEGTIDFSPVDGGDYAVTGKLEKGASSIWIEDIKTHAPVTEKIVGR